MKTAFLIIISFLSFSALRAQCCCADITLQFKDRYAKNLANEGSRYRLDTLEIEGRNGHRHLAHRTTNSDFPIILDTGCGLGSIRLVITDTLQDEHMELEITQIPGDWPFRSAPLLFVKGRYRIPFDFLPSN